MKAKITTHIIGGKYRGLKLDLPTKNTTRSTKSILKESLFNTISNDIIDENFIEVFGGSGSIVIEAISRGAKHGFAIEIDKEAYEILLSNCKKVDISKFTCKRGDNSVLLGNIINSLQKPAYLYFDPPFEFRENMDNIYQKCFDILMGLDSKKVKLAIFEHFSDLKMPKTLGDFNLIKRKKFGKSSLSYYK